jgi:hypothetical protein
MPLGPSQLVANSIGCLVLRANFWYRAEFLGITPAHASREPVLIVFVRFHRAGRGQMLGAVRRPIPFGIGQRCNAADGPFLLDRRWPNLGRPPRRTPWP